MLWLIYYLEDNDYWTRCGSGRYSSHKYTENILVYIGSLFEYKHYYLLAVIEYPWSMC